MKIRLKLREKLLLYVISSLMVCFVSFGAIRIYQAKASFTEDMNRSGQERVQLIAESLTNLILAYDYSNIESLAERIVKLEDVQSIHIMNQSGRVMVSRLNAKLNNSVRGLTFSSPILFSGQEIGKVEIELSTQKLRDSVNSTYRNVIFVITLFGALLGGVLYISVSIFIIKPLIRLNEAANKLAEGDFSANLPAIRDDELGNLVRSFASMREARQKTENELNNLNASLESIVMARVAELRASEQYVHAILENVNEGIIVIDENERVESFNTAAEKIFGYDSKEIVKQHFGRLLSGESLSLTGRYHRFNPDENFSPAFGVTREVVGIRKDLSAFPLELKTNQLRIQNRLLFITTARDISDRKEAEQRIRYMASHDALTSLPNRTLLQDRIQQTLVHNGRRNLRAAVLFIDLDKFKLINDTLGHDIGDGLLMEAATRLIGCIRNEDTVARQGGDEFIILLSQISTPPDAGSIAEKLLESLLRPFLIKGKELHISASIGIAIYPDDGTSMEQLLKNSDTAMYHAKESGRSNYQYFSGKMNEQAAEKQVISSELRHAIERNQLSLAYQPVVDIRSNAICGLEVLLRWQHPDHGMIPPAKFIPLAEESGYILAIGDWVMRTTCQQISSWQQLGYDVPRIAINLSAKQFRQKQLAEHICAILDETGIKASSIGIEITESMLVENVEDVVNTLLTLSNMGLEISIDDFGTGYSSLSYLKRFPINKLKIDKSFINDVATHLDDAAIVKAILAMAMGLGMTVVTEGVETEAQLAFLKQHQCDQYQGYLFSKPLSPLEITALLPRNTG